MITGMGGILGVLFGAVLLRVFRRTIGFHLEALNIPFVWPEWYYIGVLAASAVLLSLVVGALGAAYPALSASRADPYDAIRAGD